MMMHNATIRLIRMDPSAIGRIVERWHRVRGDQSACQQCTAFFQERIRNLGAESYAGYFVPSASYVISPQWNVSAGAQFYRRLFDSFDGFDRRDWLLEPVAMLEYVLPDAWFGDRNSALLGRPALDIQVVYERYLSNFDAANYTIWYPGTVLKLGWRF